MIYTGVDIEDISRFNNKDETFLNRIFTKNELEYCFKNKNHAPHLAARFCAKEAVVKAICAAGFDFVPYNKIEILNNNKIPFVNLLVEGFNEYRFSLSLAHEKQKAIAYVIMYKEK